MTRSSLEILLSAQPPRHLEQLPAAGLRAPWMSDGHWRDHLLVFARGHCTCWTKSTYLADPAVEHQLAVYHAGTFLTPPVRMEPARDALWTTGWSGGVSPRPRLLS